MTSSTASTPTTHEPGVLYTDDLGRPCVRVTSDATLDAFWERLRHNQYPENLMLVADPGETPMGRNTLTVPPMLPSGMALHVASGSVSTHQSRIYVEVTGRGDFESLSNEPMDRVVLRDFAYARVRRGSEVVASGDSGVDVRGGESPVGDVTLHGRASATTYNCVVHVYDDATVECHNGDAYVYDRGDVAVYGGTAELYGQAKAEAWDHASVTARESSSVTAYDAHVESYDNASVNAFNGCDLLAHGKSTVTAQGSVNLTADPGVTMRVDRFVKVEILGDATNSDITDITPSYLSEERPERVRYPVLDEEKVVLILNSGTTDPPHLVKFARRDGEVVAVSEFNKYRLKWNPPMSVLVGNGSHLMTKLEALTPDERRVTKPWAKFAGQGTGHCVLCGRELRNPDSQSQGYGPECADKLAP